MGENQAERTDPDQAGISRRRLVKSALVAAPVVLTLRSGAALANASAYQCVTRDQNSPEAGIADPLLEPSQQDTHPWVHKSVACRQLGDKKQNPTETFWVYQDPVDFNWHKEREGCRIDTSRAGAVPEFPPGKRA